jgi:hypothetical protein
MSPSLVPWKIKKGLSLSPLAEIAKEQVKQALLHAERRTLTNVVPFKSNVVLGVMENQIGV